MFKEARFKLTSWYLLIIFLVSFTFSSAIYQMLSHEVERFSQAQRLMIVSNFGEGPSKFTIPLDDELVKETKARILWGLIYINSVILLISGGLGYFLAGRTLKPIKEMMDDQKRFISDASHEIRTPLTALISSIEVSLRDRKMKLSEAKTQLKNNLEDVNKLKSLSDKLLSLSSRRLESVTKTRLSLNKVVLEGIKNVEPIAKYKKVRILKKLKKMTLSGDKDHLTELFTIILDNAVKYSSENSKVEVSNVSKRDKVIVKIKDYGQGISKENMPYIFDRFYRADQARTEPGFGLGLSIAKQIVTAHGGYIGVESKEGKGSTFTVYLPKA